MLFVFRDNADIIYRNYNHSAIVPVHFFTQSLRYCSQRKHCSSVFYINVIIQLIYLTVYSVFTASLRENNGIVSVYNNIIDAQKNSSFILSFKPQPSSSTQTDAVSKAIEYINANYSNDISLTEISDYVSFSSYYFSRYFKNKTGETFSNYLNRIRMEKARNLLEATDMSCVSIAQAVGYNSKNHFYHMFKLYYNCTPNEYRNRKD